MEKFFNKITSLIEVKKIIALVVVIVFCSLAVNGTIDANAFTNIAVMIVGYYFGQSTIKGAK
ncbi:hypothetical protein [Clostridium chrysemydis]|uniref:hypothetical protein n=1 Tax=Clostridium chrysemydis TaxID=2665504 RepID=UPI001883CB27|nr:hypothetical protein [Clostridium chrysemydis]